MESTQITFNNLIILFSFLVSFFPYLIDIIYKGIEKSQTFYDSSDDTSSLNSFASDDTLASTTDDPLTIEEKKEINYEDKYGSQWDILISKESSSSEIIEKDMKYLKTSFLLERCPLGNVCMYYNSESESFEYYSDFNIPFRFLETIGRRYAIVNHCPQIYIDMKTEIEKAMEQSQTKEVTKEEETKDEKNSMFANFKSYNSNKTSKSKSMIPLSKGRQELSLQLPESLKRKFKSAINEERLYVLKEKSNHYVYKGKLSNFNFLQKPPSKKEPISYKDFISSNLSKK